jgi:hypothetical protein
MVRNGGFAGSGKTGKPNHCSFVAAEFFSVLPGDVAVEPGDIVFSSEHFDVSAMLETYKKEVFRFLNF